MNKRRGYFGASQTKRYNLFLSKDLKTRNYMNDNGIHIVHSIGIFLELNLGRKPHPDSKHLFTSRYNHRCPNPVCIYKNRNSPIRQTGIFTKNEK
jgi:hypothetical protein